MHLFLLTAGLFVLTCSAPDAKGESVTLPAVADTSVFEANPDNNLGGLTTLASGTSDGEFGGTGEGPGKTRALMRFDIASQLPTNATVLSATLTVNVLRVPLVGGLDSIFGLHKVLQLWGEGDKAGAGTVGDLATNGEATWNARQYPSVLWGSPGAAAGVDYADAASASALVMGLDAYIFESTSNLVADVQSWLNSSNSNFGWILISNDEGIPTTVRRFGSRESGTNAPLLQVEYTTQPILAPTITLTALTNGQITFRFDAQAQLQYTVQYNDSLAATNWLALTIVTNQLVATNIVVTDPATNGQRFYRIRVP
jgi:hypothetical protein